MDREAHPGMKRLIAYREGTLPEAEREDLQEHLSLCPRCTGLLRELRDFEAAAAGKPAEGPEPLKQEAWDSLVRSLPKRAPVQRKAPRPVFLYAAAAALLFAVAGLSIWATVTIQQERSRLAGLERQLKERESALAAAQGALAEAERRLEAVRGQTGGQVEELEARIAELNREMEELRRTPPATVASGIGLSTSPRFVLRGQTPPEPLRGGGAVNPVPRTDRITAALSLPDHPYGEYRLELVDREGKVLWSGRRPAGSVLGDAGSSVAITGLGPGRYRLRIEGLNPDRTELLGEYLLEVSP